MDFCICPFLGAVSLNVLSQYVHLKYGGWMEGGWVKWVYYLPYLGKPSTLTNHIFGLRGLWRGRTTQAMGGLTLPFFRGKSHVMSEGAATNRDDFF